MTPIAAAVRATDDLDRVFDALAREANGGLIVVSDLGMTNHRDALIALAAHHRVPAVYPFRYFATSGGLMSYGTDVAEVFRRAAAYVDRILRGEIRPTFQCKRRLSTSWSSISRLPRRSASKFRRRCSPAPTR